MKRKVFIDANSAIKKGCGLYVAQNIHMSRYYDVICKKNLNHDHVRHIILFKAFGFNLSVVTLSNMLNQVQ